MFTQDQRTRIRTDLLERAAQDERISAAAITGSAAGGNEDEWSDIDLAFGLKEGDQQAAVLADWTDYLYATHSALHHLDVVAGLWIYRVFLLPGTLQVDLAFVDASDFRALAPTFRLVFGTAREARSFPSPSAADLIGPGWLYALHARTCIARGRVWQAEHMISALRDQALALTCLRHGLSTFHGKGIDALPAEITAPLEGALVLKLDVFELSRAFRATVHRFLDEVRIADGELAARLYESLGTLVSKEP